jgi:hypothetical protein
MVPWSKVWKNQSKYSCKRMHKVFWKDFQDNHSPAINDTTFHIMTVLKILLILEAGQVDIGTSFQNRKLGEQYGQIYMIVMSNMFKYNKQKEKDK